VIAVVVASLAVLVGLASLAAGGTAVLVDRTLRDASGYVMSGSSQYLTDTYAVVSDSYRTRVGGDVLVPSDLLGTIRIRTRSAQPVFVGIGPAAAVDSYLAGVEREVADRFYWGQRNFRLYSGTAPRALPATKQFWAAQSVGSGTQTLAWSPASGHWRIVLMNRDGAAGVDADLAIGARFPHLFWIGIGALGAGVVLLLLGAGGIHAVHKRT
jgi:hypothetical protein